MRILFCFAQSALIRSKWNQIALNHQLFSASGNFGVSRSNSDDTLCLRQSKSCHRNAGKNSDSFPKKLQGVSEKIGHPYCHNKAITQRNTTPLENPNTGRDLPLRKPLPSSSMTPMFR